MYGESYDFKGGLFLSIYDLSRRYARFCLEGVPGGLLHHFLYHLGREYGSSVSAWEDGTRSVDFLVGERLSIRDWMKQLRGRGVDWNRLPTNRPNGRDHYVCYARGLWSMPVYAEYAYRAFELPAFEYRHVMEQIQVALRDEEYPEVIVYFEAEGKKSPLAPRSFNMLKSIYEQWLSDMSKRGVEVYRVPSMLSHGWEYRLIEELERICPQPPCTL